VISSLDELYPYSHTGLVLRDADVAVLRTDAGHLCGYCAFDDEEIPSHWRGNYDAPGLQFLAIHGGLTYAEHKAPFSIFGFDCAHSGDDCDPKLRNPEHVMGLAHQMRAQLSAFAARRDEWLTASREERAAIIDSVSAGAEFKTEPGLAGMLEILMGAPSLGEPA